MRNTQDELTISLFLEDKTELHRFCTVTADLVEKGLGQLAYVLPDELGLFYAAPCRVENAFLGVRAKRLQEYYGPHIVPFRNNLIPSPLNQGDTLTLYLPAEVLSINI